MRNSTMRVRIRTAIGIAVFVCILVGAVITVLSPRNPHVDSADYPGIVRDCRKIFSTHQQGETIRSLKDYPHLRKLHPLEVSVEENAVLIIQRNRIGYLCRLRTSDGAWILERVGDMADQELAVFMPDTLDADPEE